MRREDVDLDIPSSVGPGRGQRCDTWVEKWVEVAGTFAGTVAVEVQLSSRSTDWVQVDTAAAGDVTLIQVAQLCYAIRVNTVAATGTPKARLVGLDRRTDA